MNETVKRRSTTFFKHESDVEEFRDVLRRKFGSITRAWRVGLDSDDSGFLDFREFNAAVKSLGFTGNLRTLWFNLDEDDSGSISLKELDPKASAALEKFRALSTRAFGSIPDMWRDCLDQDNSKTVSFNEFHTNIGVLGYADEAEIWELFNLLLVRPGSTYVTLDDIIFLQKWEENKKDQLYRKRLSISFVNKDPFLHGKPTCPNMPGSTTDPEDYSAIVGIDPEKLKEDFRQFLIKKYGSLCYAFAAMDANDSGSLSLVEFQAVVSSVLRYCRPADAARLFLSFNQDRESMLSWAELGITSHEWINFMLEKRTKEKDRRIRRAACVSAPLGSSPRHKAAGADHKSRIRQPMSRSDVAFFMPLPKGWGFPPEFDPRNAPPFSAR